MTTITVAYPSGADFDLDYYMSKHMPLVERTWAPMGLSGWRVLRGVPGQDGAAPVHQVTAELTFSSVEAFQKAASEHGTEIFADIPNYTQAKPVIQFHETVGG